MRILPAVITRWVRLSCTSIGWMRRLQNCARLLSWPRKSPQCTGPSHKPSLPKDSQQKPTRRCAGPSRRRLNRSMFQRSLFFRSLLASFLAVTIVPLMAGASSQPQKPVPPAKSQPRPSVILITIDTLRADHVGCYGAKAVKTPTLDGLAHDGVVFERASSQVPLTWPSHAVILTGTYPFQNGVQDFTGQPLAPQFRSVAQAFQQAGYATGAVVSAFVLDRSWGLGRGFDFYDDAFSAETFQKKDIGLVDRKAAESV